MREGGERRMRKLSALIATLMAVMFSVAVAFAGAPDTIVIKEVQKIKPAVTFPHKAHADRIKNCQECHHKDQAGKEEACFKCHKEKKEGDAPGLKDVAHKKCKDCHKNDATKKAPTKCDGCHKK
jgi:Class III cytochrome C family